LRDAASYDDFVSTTFFQAISGVFDTHSAYFSPHDFQEFVGALSSEDFYFGFTLDEDDNGNIIISALAPGGAAWRSGALHVSDIVLSVEFTGEEPIDIHGMSIEDVSEMLDKNNTNTVELTIRTTEGDRKKISLRKEKMQHEENVVQSFILEGSVKTGYIYLPDFYTRWNSENEGGRCASDVASEIIKMKKEGIEGLIIDLRFNGGGSLYEAGAMAGIFIDEGPLAIAKSNDQKSVVLKDMNRGTVYDGPLVIMVNGNSASASEVLAASIQDYNRGLIVGSQTYGKATGQNIFPLEQQSVSSLKSDKQPSVGYVKLTTQRLYRVTGKTAQGRGVRPDVILPDVFTALNIHESKYPFSLRADSIVKNTYYRPGKAIDKKLLQEKSRDRIKHSKSFQEIERTIGWLAQAITQKGAPVPLTWSGFLKIAQESKVQLGVFQNTENNQDLAYVVRNSVSKEERLLVDEYAREVNQRWLQKLQSDLYLSETYHILSDYITATGKL
jgi:carboxyl-terminal processing protease